MADCLLSRRWLILAVILTAAAALSGCGVAAWPVRVSSATVKVVPVVGHTVAAPLDAAADAID